MEVDEVGGACQHKLYPHTLDVEKQTNRTLAHGPQTGFVCNRCSAFLHSCKQRGYLEISIWLFAEKHIPNPVMQ